MIQLHNYTEVLVEDYVEGWLPKEDVCQCELCRMDVMAIMLNKLPPHYVVTEKGALFAQMKEFNLQHKVDLMRAMTEAVGLVRNKSRH